MIQKMDKVLSKVMQSEKNQETECLIYVQNLDSAIRFFRANNTKITGVFPFLKAISVSAKNSSLKNLIINPNIKFMSADLKVFAMMNVAREILKTNGYGGENISIAYIDTGISQHLDFSLPQNRIIKFLDLINNKQKPYDDNGHGTFVCGVGSGNGLVSNGKLCGICPQSNIVAVKALNESGEANASKILEAMQWIYSNKTKYNIKVVCMSFGSESLGENDPIMKGANKLWESGITVVAAAGNSGPEYHTIKSPGISPKIITVGGFDDNRLNNDQFEENFFEIAQFSSRGPSLNAFKPDVVAPAVDISSCGVQEFYTTLSGTSVATPMIAGLCALYLSKHANFTPDQIKKLLLSSCVPISFNRNKEGAGRPVFK